MHPSPRNWWKTTKSIKNATCPPIGEYSDWQAWRLWRTSQPWVASTVSNVRVFCKLSHGKMKQRRVAVITEKLCLHCEMILLKNSNGVWKPVLFGQDQVLQQHLSIDIHGCISYRKCPDWWATGKHLKMQVFRLPTDTTNGVILRWYLVYKPPCLLLPARVAGQNHYFNLPQ